jgi:SNF family Na+-dependent transporter
MSVLILVMFLMGLLCLLFDYINIFGWLAPWWSIGLMVLSFIMLTRIWQKESKGEKESLLERIEKLEERLRL